MGGAVKEKAQHAREELTEIPVIHVDSFIFKDRSLSVLESLVFYLKEVKKYSYHEIAVILNRDDRTIWTVHNRAIKKRKRNGS